MLGNIDLSLKALNPQLFICRPDINRTIIGTLTEAKGLTHDILLGKVNEINFNVPYEVESHHELIKNPNIDKLKERYLIKLVLGMDTEFFMINEINDSADDTKNSKTVHAFSLTWELNDKLIRGYEDNVTARVALEEALYETTWNIGYIDSDFLLRTRAFEVSEKSVLDFIFEIADSFNAVVDFNTVNRVINLVKEENVGQNKGLRISYGKYLKTLGKQSNSDEMVTRLHVFGNENLSIQRLNPTGATYLENFSHFMSPFAMDSQGNVTQQSGHMSDDLCKAIIKYQALVASKTNEFNELLAKMDTYQQQLATKDVELKSLELEYKKIEDKLFIAKGMGNSTSALESQLATQASLVNSKKSEISSIESQTSSIDNQIASLRSQISVENNFTPNLIKERNYFIIEKTWEDDNFIDDKELYDEAIKRFSDMKKPKTTFTVDIVNFLRIVESQRDWDKLSIGDTVTIEYEQLDEYVTAKIMEIHHDYDSDKITLTISNAVDIRDEAAKTADRIYDAYSTSTSLDMSKYKWNGAVANLGEVNDVINNVWDTTKREIVAGVDNSISISGRGIVITNPLTPNKQLIAQAGVLALTENGGNTWKTAILPDRIVAEVVMGKLIAGVNLIIENDSGTYRIDGSGFNITKADGNVKIGMSTTDGFRIQSRTSSYGSWSDKFSVSTNGDLNFSGVLVGASGTFSGSLQAATGTFSGELKAATGTFSGSLQAASGTFTGDVVGGSFKSSDKSSSFEVQAGNMKLSTTGGSYITISPTGVNGYSSSGTNVFKMDNSLITSAALGTSNFNVYLASKGEARIVDYANLPGSGSVADYTYRDLRCGAIRATDIYSNGTLIPTQDWINSNFWKTGSSGWLTNNIYATTASMGIGGSPSLYRNPSNTSFGSNSIFVPDNVYCDSVEGNLSVLELSNNGSANLYIGNDGSNYLQSNDVYYRTYGDTVAHVGISSSGTLGRITSASKYKANIQEQTADKFPKILELIPKVWYDKFTLERNVEYNNMTCGIDMDGNPVECEDVPGNFEVPYLSKGVGFIAEDLVEIGLEDYVIYGAADVHGNREVEGIAYDRLWHLLVPIVKSHEEKIQTLEEEKEDLKSRLLKLEGLVSKLIKL